MVPPSVHPSGEQFVWELGDEPAQVDGNVLRRAVRLVAAMVLVAEHWPRRGSRHDCTLALAGFLLRGGLGEKTTVLFVEAVVHAAGDDEPAKRISAARDTARELARGGRVTGGPRLAALLHDGTKVLEKLQDWLRVQAKDGRTERGSHSTHEEARKSRPSQADVLVELAQGAKFELFHTLTGEPFITIPVRGHRETWPVRSKAIRRYLCRLFWNVNRKALSTEALQAALGVLEGQAVFEGKQEPVHLRTAWHDGALYYDLCDAHWRAVKVTGEGWALEVSPPVRFRRYSHMAPQVEPRGGGCLDALWGFVNISPERESNRRLLKRALITALIPDIPRPIVVLHGDQGSGKSFAARVLGGLVDPSEAPLVRAKEEAELVQGLAHHYVAILDNLSFLPESLSDLLSRAVTGEGFTKRQLYTDEEDVTFTYRRWIILSGIALVITKPDLLDRPIIFELERMPDDMRHEERVLWQRFHEQRPRLFGAQLDALAGAIREYAGVTLHRLPRMADFGRWAVAVDRGLGEGAEQFALDFSENVQRQNEEAIAGSPTATVLLAFFETRTEWEGQAHELLGDLQHQAEVLGFHRRQFPGSASSLSRKLREVRPSLKSLGLEIVFNTHHHPRTIAIRRVAEKAAPGARLSPSQQTQLVSRDSTGDSRRQEANAACHTVPSKNPILKGWDGGDSRDGTLRTPSDGLQED